MRESSNPVLLHGFTGSSESWGSAVVDGLAGAGCPPVLVDLPGHGRHAGETTAHHFTLESALESISGAGSWPTPLIGYSMGGRLALHFAVRHPERVERLVLESASPGLATDRQRSERRVTDEALARRVEEIGVENFAGYWESLPLFETRARLAPEVRERVRQVMLLNDARSLAASLRGFGTGTLPSLWERLREVRVPVLLIAGELDHKFVDIARRMEAALPSARLEVVPGAGHTVHLERPGDWLDAVTGFLGEGRDADRRS